MYFIHEDGDAEFGFTWDLFFQGEAQDRAIRIGTFYGEADAEKFKAAVQWYETLQGGSMSIPKKAQKSLKIIFTPEKKRTKK